MDAPVTRVVSAIYFTYMWKFQLSSLQISRKENFDLPMKCAAKIANKYKQNLRKVIMALKACIYLTA
ncbi:hypothetical protein HanIR_Chr07g0319191 [Helianthus annuus]|nr:hypothetical protein HanIR_Chr07g0319191 [Helianthus annuus]